MTVQFRWPLGMPLVDHLGSGIWEIRSRLANRIARTLFFVHEEEIILLHGFIKKTQKTPNEDRLLEDVQAAAFKRALALKVNDMMKEKRMNKSAMAARMRTSRAAVHRLLDPKNTSVTLATLNRAARSLGCKVKIEFVPA